jgi:hypothetical protein
VVGQVSEWSIDYIEDEASVMIAYLESCLGCVVLGCQMCVLLRECGPTGWVRMGVGG